ncbi:TRAP transporter small permease [Halomonas heilongjiangensis]|uniref:TRAP transporter small permease protein n=1 Tax=Halomonas heilongjiangensis TaxID=1387883 RepID=A0A2N7TGN2_9GAMM|nr:TRAP transporter small permease [Halomonas heilongjiangensis]PMR67346.1 TRAP transporter small permease [Halomonas heilongjiangensis]PXX88122.1 C4-dicarboxylate ABC transporter permease [Halomonas heilongjiangensis]
MKQLLLKIFDNLENYICQFLLVFFVVLLFVQIVLRNVFSGSLAWGDELATYAFVWFAYMGAVYAAKMSAHNRVTFQFKFFPRVVEKVCNIVTDLIWVGFNLYFVYLSYDFVFNRMNVFWKSQTMGVPMKYFYLILPLAFLVMSVRILQNMYVKHVMNRQIMGPEDAQIEEMKRTQNETHDKS